MFLASNICWVRSGTVSALPLQDNEVKHTSNNIILPVLLAASGCEGGKPRHEEVKPREGDHVDSKLSEISIKLAWESKTGGHTRHSE